MKGGLGLNGYSLLSRCARALLGEMKLGSVGLLLLWLSAGARCVWAGQPQLLWKYPVSAKAGYFAAEATPAVAPDGTVYVATFVGQVLAVSAEGQVRWLFSAGREIHSALAVGDDGTVYFGSRDHRFYAVTSEGKLRWTFCTGDWVDSSPALAADGTIYFGSWDGNFYALDPQGNLKWKFATGGIVDSSPAIGVDGTIYFGGHDGWFYALKPDGSVRWKYQVGAVIPSSPAIGADGRVIFTAMNHQLYTLSARGQELWHCDARNITASSPILTPQGNIYFSPQVTTVGYDSEGKKIFETGMPILQSISPLAGPDGYLYAGIPWRRFACFSNSCWSVWDYHTETNPQGSMVLNPDGRMYVLDERWLYAFAGDWPARPWKLGTWPMLRANARHTGRVTPE